jgi:glycosyltransferase involved in cell wall biosynthesis
MAQGLPAFASSSGGAEEIVIHDENGYLVEPGDIDGFVSILLRLIKDREKLLRLSLYARRRFDSFPTWKQTGITIRNFLLKVASFNNKPKTDRP